METRKQHRFKLWFGSMVWTLAGAMVLPGCGDGGGPEVLRMGHSLDTTHPVHKAMEVMAQHIKEHSRGQLTLKIYPNSQLGSEREMIELTQLGAIDLVKTSVAPLEGFVPAMAVFGVPYLFRNEDHYWQVLEGKIGQQLLEASEEKRLRGLCYYDAGSRSFYTRERPVVTPEDLRGMKIRVQSSKTAMRMIEALGGAPTPISFGELYSALEQGVVDGAENNPPSLLTSRHYEVCKFYTLDEHTRVPDIVLISTARWARLNSEQRVLLQEAARESARFQRELWARNTEETLRRLENAGVQILRPDKKPFQTKVQSLDALYQGTEVGRLIEQIRNHPPESPAPGKEGRP